MRSKNVFLKNRRFSSNRCISEEDFSLIRVYKGILSMQGRAGLCARALRRETRLTVYPARSVLPSEIEYKICFVSDPELLRAPKIGLMCEESYETCEKEDFLCKQKFIAGGKISTWLKK